MAIEGTLHDVSLPDLAQLLAMGRKTGCLTLTDRSNFGYVYFREGRVIHASVLNRPDRLGDLLVQNGVITPEQLSEAVSEHARNRDVRLGQVLVRQGGLSEERLQDFIRLQIEEAVYHLFTWARGSFHFDPGQEPDEEGALLVDLPVENLLLEGARRIDEWELIEKKVPSFDLVFARVKEPGAVPEVDLTDAQERVLALIDGARTVDDIVTESGLVEFEVGKAVFGLVQAGFVERAGRRRAERGEAEDQQVTEHATLGMAFYRSGMLEDAAREFEAVLAVDPDHVLALHRLGLIALRGGHPARALEFLDRMPDAAQENYAVTRNRALTLELLERYDEALAALEFAEAVRPGQPETALARGVVLLRMGEVSPALDALREYRKAAAVTIPSAVYYAYAVLAAAMAGRLDYAVAVGREGLVHHPRSAPLLIHTGAVLELRGEDQAAGALYARATRLPGAPAQAHKALGDLALERSDPARARAHYESALARDPELGDDVYARLGSIARDASDQDGARLLWARALELNPDNEMVRTALKGLSTDA